jgi:hypothetical protein
MSNAKASQIVSVVQKGSRNGALVLVDSDGRTHYFEEGKYWKLNAALGGWGDSLFIVIEGGQSHMPRDAAEGLLIRMMDSAHASETKFRLTGKGNTDTDVIMQNQMRLPDEGIKTDAFGNPLPQTYEEYLNWDWVNHKPLPPK